MRTERPDDDIAMLPNRDLCHRFRRSVPASSVRTALPARGSIIKREFPAPGCSDAVWMCDVGNEMQLGWKSEMPFLKTVGSARSFTDSLGNL